MTEGTNNQAITAANFDALRAVSQQLTGTLESLEGHRKQLVEIKAAARAEASVGSKTGSPAPILSPLLTSLDTAIAKVDTAIAAFKNNVGADAAALSKLANDLEDATRRGAQQATQAANG